MCGIHLLCSLSSKSAAKLSQELGTGFWEHQGNNSPCSTIYFLPSFNTEGLRKRTDNISNVQLAQCFCVATIKHFRNIRAAVWFKCNRLSDRSQTKSRIMAFHLDHRIQTHQSGVDQSEKQQLKRWFNFLFLKYWVHIETEHTECEFC